MSSTQLVSARLLALTTWAHVRYRKGPGHKTRSLRPGAEIRLARHQFAVQASNNEVDSPYGFHTLHPKLVDYLDGQREEYPFQVC